MFFVVSFYRKVKRFTLCRSFFPSGGTKRKAVVVLDPEIIRGMHGICGSIGMIDYTGLLVPLFWTYIYIYIQHHQLNLRLEEEVIAGCTGMHHPFRHLIRSYILLVLSQMDIPSKKLLLRYVHLAHKEFAAPAYQPDVYADERSFMLNWFT